MAAASSSSSSVFFIFFLFFFLFISEATVPPSATFHYVNSGELEDTNEIFTEYDPDYRFLPPFATPFDLCFYNTTPNAYILALRMGRQSDRSLKRWVWEANRGRPVGDNAALSFGSDGNLVLTDADGQIAWQTNTANKGVVGFAILPNGNIVLRDAAGRFVWQSFDYPTDTLLYGQSLRVGGPNYKLVSRASATENVDGNYSFVLEPERLALYYKKTMLYWSSTFPEVNKASRGLVNATLEITEAEYSDGNYNSLRFRLANASDQPTVLLGTNRYNSTFSYLRLGIDGNLRLYGYRRVANAVAWSLLYTWFNRDWRNSLEGIEDECQLPGRCGKFGLCEDSQCVGCPTPKGVYAWSKDCVAKSPGCQASGFRYYEVKGVDHFTVKYSSGMGPVDRKVCESKCTKDCKCLGYFYHTDQSRCWIAYELKTLTRVGNSTHIAYIKTPV